MGWPAVSKTTATSIRARIAANARWAKESDRSAATARARATFEARFEDQVDPERKLTEEERWKRVKNARAAYYARIAPQRHLSSKRC